MGSLVSATGCGSAAEELKFYLILTGLYSHFATVLESAETVLGLVRLEPHKRTIKPRGGRLNNNCGWPFFFF